MAVEIYTKDQIPDIMPKPFSQKHSSNCLKPWSAKFPIYILKYQSKETKESGEHNATATCCRYSCVGELEIILTSIVMCSEKTTRYAYIPHGWETDITYLEQCSSRMVLYMNVSARGGWLEPEVLWIRRDQAAAPVNLVKSSATLHDILLILLDIFILFLICQLYCCLLYTSPSPRD